VYPYVGPEALPDILERATLVIGRSGANTTMEVATTGIPAICIPLPWSGGGEQQQNAEWLAKKGTATVLIQSTTSPEILLRTIHDMLNTISDSTVNARKLASTMPRDGASRVSDVIESLL
jgi:UDP-N-acetylglucosamine--N-acetylmuramyl-(pentapeptide) pyrophosphoryl-undecaprenol N-acetylglucosamine transferase